MTMLFSSTSRRGAYSSRFVLGGALLLWNCVQVLGQNCPEGSIDHCDDPDVAAVIWDADPTVACNRQTCEWQTELFSPTNKPIHCLNLDFVRASDPVTDFLEPCILWELIYGEFAPTAAPTVSMQPTESKQPTVAPTSAPSVSPTATPSSLPSVSPTPLPTARTPEPTSAPTKEPTATSQGVSSVNTPSQPTTSNFNNILLTYIFPGEDRRQLRALSSLSFASRAELYYLTEAHLESTIPNLEKLQLVVTPYQEVVLEGQTAVTEVLQGSITLSISQADVSALFLASFSGSNLASYLDRLREADDPKLRSVLDTSYGIPLGIPDTGNTYTGDRSSGNAQDDKDGGVDGLWIGILICGAAGLLGLLAVAFVLLSRNSNAFRRTLGLKTANTGSFSQGSPTSMEPQLIRRMQSVDMEDSPAGHNGEEMKLDDDELPEGTRGDVTFGDMQSEITSVYSYVDRTCLNESVMTDNESYSLAPSFLMRKSHDVHGDEDGVVSPGENNSSVMWSVMDGLGDQSAAHKSPQKSKPTNTSAAEKSPSSLVISATRPATDEHDTYIFNDDVSLVSETSETVTSKLMQVPTVDSRPASPIPNNDSFRSSMESNIKSVTTRSFSLESTTEKLAKNDDKRSASFSAILRPKEAEPVADLSQVMEASETSHVSSEGRLSAPSSVSKSRRSSTVGLPSKEESTDDDSSLFMGPDSFSKENAQGNNKLLSLGDGNKISPTEDRESYRIAPLFRTTGRLSDKDKGQLGVRRAPSKDDSSLAESMTYPDAYAVASFRDDMSISTAGSTRRTKYSAATMASF